jgi:hypothetical protein
VGILVDSLGDPSGLVAESASASLINPIFQADAVPLLVASFRRPSPVPFFASKTLVHISGNIHGAAVNALQAALSSTDLNTQKWAAVTLGQSSSQDPSVKEALTKLEQNAKSTDLKWVAEEALKQLASS